MLPPFGVCQPHLQSLYYSFIQTGSTNGANVPESYKDATHDLKLLASQQAAINRECKHSAQLSLSDIPRSSVFVGDRAPMQCHQSRAHVPAPAHACARRAVVILNAMRPFVVRRAPPPLTWFSLIERHQT